MSKTILREIDQLQEEINNQRPLTEQQRAQIREYFRIGLTYTSNALEGNSLTESETKVVLEEGITIGGKRLVDHLEAVGHSDAFNHLFDLASKRDFTEDDIKKLHWLFYYRIDAAHAGVYRTKKVHITGSKYPLPAPKELVELMAQLPERLNMMRPQLHPVEFAALAHKEFVFIHPFVDGNGRVARLLMNLALLQAGYVTTIIPAVVRHEYIALLERAHVDDRDFIMFIARMAKETQKDYLRLFA